MYSALAHPIFPRPEPRPGAAAVLVRRIAAPALLALAGCGVLGPDSRPDPQVRVVAATDLGLLQTNPLIRGRDGGYSGVFAGRSVWLYGDTVLEQADARGQNWLHNSWSWTPDLDGADGIGGFSEALDAAGAPQEFFPLTPEEQAFNDAHLLNDCSQEPCGARWALWPGALVDDPARDRALVFYVKIYAEPGDFNFRGVGSSVAVWRSFGAAPERPLLDRVPEHPTLMFGRHEPAFGGAALAVGDTLYVYGRDGDNFKKRVHVARVPLGQVLDRAAWKFYDGQGAWTPDLKGSTPVFSGNDMMSIYYDDYLARYVSLYSKPFSRDVVLRTAPRPEGPWSTALQVFKAQAPTSDNGWIYDALAHPEYASDGGRTQYITYSRVTGFLAAEVRLVAVELERITADTH